MALGFAGEGVEEKGEITWGEGMEEWRKTSGVRARAEGLGREDAECAGAGGGGTAREAALGSASRGLAELR